MAKNAIETVKDIFTSGQESSPRELTEADMDANLAEIKKRINDDTKVPWHLAWDVLISKLIEALGDKIPDIIGEVWAKYKEIQEYTDEGKYPPDKSSVVPIIEHTIKSEYQPYIEIKYKNLPFTGKIDFNIEVSLILNGINLVIQGGRIMGIKGGSCKGSGVIKCKGIEILNKETRQFDLPGTISLGKGIPIPKMAE